MKLTASLITLLVVVGCVTVEKGALQIGPESLSTATNTPPVTDVPRETEKPPEAKETPPAWWDNEALWATVLSTIGIVGHRIYSQHKGQYAKTS